MLAGDYIISGDESLASNVLPLGVAWQRGPAGQRIASASGPRLFDVAELVMGTSLRAARPASAQRVATVPPAGDANEGEEGAKKGRKKAGETKAAGAGRGRGRPKGAAGAKGGAAKGAGRGLKKTAGGGVKKARGGGAAKSAKPKPKAKASKPLGGAGKKGSGKGK